MAGNVATVLNPENYKQIYNEGKVIFDKNTYNDLGDDLKDMFSGQSYGYTREKRKKEKEAKDKADQLAGDKQWADYFSKRPLTQYVDDLYHKLINKYAQRIQDTFWGPEGMKHPMGDSLIEWKRKANDLQTKEAVDESKQQFEEKLKQELDKTISKFSTGGHIEDIPKQVENSLYQLKRQFGDIASFWKDKFGIKRHGGFQR